MAISLWNVGHRSLVIRPEAPSPQHGERRAVGGSDLPRVVLCVNSDSGALYSPQGSEPCGVI